MVAMAGRATNRGRARTPGAGRLVRCPPTVARAPHENAFGRSRDSARHTAALVRHGLGSLRRLGSTLLVVFAALGAAGARADEAQAPVPPPAPLSWQNPVLEGDFPDPSAVQVDGVFWATATSSARAPGFPLLRSTDLVHWQQIGSIFRRAPRWAAGSLWAPELVVDQAGVRGYYTARPRPGALCGAVPTPPAPRNPAPPPHPRRALPRPRLAGHRRRRPPLRPLPRLPRRRWRARAAARAP